jgi:hypothetical protein
VRTPGRRAGNAWKLEKAEELRWGWWRQGESRRWRNQDGLRTFSLLSTETEDDLEDLLQEFETRNTPKYSLLSTSEAPEAALPQAPADGLGQGPGGPSQDSLPRTTLCDSLNAQLAAELRSGSDATAKAPVGAPTTALKLGDVAGTQPKSGTALPGSALDAASKPDTPGSAPLSEKLPEVSLPGSLSKLKTEGSSVVAAAVATPASAAALPQEPQKKPSFMRMLSDRIGLTRKVGRRAFPPAFCSNEDPATPHKRESPRLSPGVLSNEDPATPHKRES